MKNLKKIKELLLQLKNKKNWEPTFCKIYEILKKNELYFCKISVIEQKIEQKIRQKNGQKNKPRFEPLKKEDLLGVVKVLNFDEFKKAIISKKHPIDTTIHIGFFKDLEIEAQKNKNKFYIDSFSWLYTHTIYKIYFDLKCLWYLYLLNLLNIYIEADDRLYDNICVTYNVKIDEYSKYRIKYILDKDNISVVVNYYNKGFLVYKYTFVLYLSVLSYLSNESNIEITIEEQVDLSKPEAERFVSLYFSGKGITHKNVFEFWANEFGKILKSKKEDASKKLVKKAISQFLEALERKKNLN